MKHRQSQGWRRVGRAWRLAFLVVLGAGTTLLVVVLTLYLTVPKSNEANGPVDVLLVLGTPAGMHGELTEMQRWRTEEGVREFFAGRAPRILFSGGPTSHFVCEADVMAAYARQLGVPASAILRERRSFTTMQNIANSRALIEARGWRRIEVVSTAEHLPRAAVILEKTDLQWRTHVAPTPGRSWTGTAVAFAEEAIGTAVLRVFGDRAEPVLHVFSTGQHRLAWGVRWLYYTLRAGTRRH